MKRYLGITYENILIGLYNRFLQGLARTLPGSGTIRVWCHRARGVHIGEHTFIGTDVIIDTSLPKKVSIGNNVAVGMRVTLIGHIGNKGLDDKKHVTDDKPSLVIEDEVYIGPGVIILPDVKVGKGAVISAGSVVTKSVRPHTMVQGNPAVPIAKCGIALTRSTPLWEFYRNLKPIKKKIKPTQESMEIN